VPADLEAQMVAVVPQHRMVRLLHDEVEAGNLVEKMVVAGMADLLIFRGRNTES